MSLLLAKVGGSLFDIPHLGPKLLRWSDEQPERKILFLAGGGDFVEALRRYQPIQGLTEVEAHWLAVRTLAVSARMLAAMLGNLPVISDESEQPKSVLDCHAFLEADEHRPDALPKSWSVTTDSIAAQAGIRFGATRVVLLKSRPSIYGTDWQAAADAGYVDPNFRIISDRVSFPVECIDFREWANTPGG